METVKLHQLYRHFDSNGELLYVGISLSAILRLKQHTKNAKWNYLIARVEIENFNTRKECIDAEIYAITNENPKYNICHTSHKYIISRTHGMTKVEEKRIARERRATLYAEYKASGAKSFRAFALMKGDLTPMRYWQILSMAARELAH